MADTVAALQEMFQAKRKSSGWFLAAAPVALGATVAGVGVSLASQLGPSPNAAGPLLVLGAGALGTVAVLNRYTRYTKGSERAILSKYERTHRLPKWVGRNLTRHRAAKP